jgi:hypothetical protein
MPSEQPTVEIPSTGITVLVSRSADATARRLGLTPLRRVCGDLDPVLAANGRAVVALGLDTLDRLPALANLAATHQVAVVGLLDAATLRPAQMTQVERALRTAGVSVHHRVTGTDTVRSVALPVDARDDRGPFDVIGDVHGCAGELHDLLSVLGHRCRDGTWWHPERRRVVLLGDLIDRGPDSPAVLRTVMALCAQGHGRCVLGNHDDKLRRYLDGHDVQPAASLAATLDQLRTASDRDDIIEPVATFVRGLPDHLVLDGGALVVAHAGLPSAFHGRVGRQVRHFALHGHPELTHTPPAEHPDWVASYTGDAAVVHGHHVVDVPHWHNGVLGIDTGCVFGGRLTALRWPERELVSVPARQRWWDRTADRPDPVVAQVPSASNGATGRFRATPNTSATVKATGANQR